MEPIPTQSANRSPSGPASGVAGASPSAAVRLDPYGRIREANAMAAAMLGFQPQELTGLSLQELAVEGWQAAADVAAARVRFGAMERFELALRGRSGRRTLVEMTARPGKGEEGILVSWTERRMRSADGVDEDRHTHRALYAALEREDEERRQAVSALDGDIAPLVTAAKYTVEDVLRKLGGRDPAEAAALQETAGHLRDVLVGLRRVSEALHPRLLDDLGLADAIRASCRAAEESVPGLQVSCRVEVPEDRIPAARKADVFRVAEELLRNVVRHAHARHAELSLRAGPGDMLLTVEDDGIGFDPSAPDPGIGAQGTRRGVGLRLVRARAEAAGARVVLRSQRNRGTKVHVAWPLGAAENP